MTTLTAFRGFLGKRPYAFAGLLTLTLFLVDVAVQPAFAAFSNWATVLASFAPLAVAAMASTPAILSGGGGIDISIGPALTLVNIVIVADLLPHGLSSPMVVIPICLAIGTAIGAVNGFMVAVLRFQPVVATLCANIIISGLATQLQGDSVPAGSTGWTKDLAGSFGPVPGAVLTIGAPLLIWLLLARTPFIKALYAVGGDDATAFSAGVNVPMVRIAAYALGGLFAAIAGIALMSLINEGSASMATQYTLLAIASVALGGTALSGGRGSLLGSLLGAGSIYLIDNLLNEVHVSTLWSTAIYGAMLVFAVVVGAVLTDTRRRVA
ncbi:ABC transporter permease [Actinacidiphila oryziradicis]|uniref:ABC transporter permease n=1 Tax=Actinacidiphila oryziradicis TaxID=2571141 RepID=A0A4U0SKW6_9ACTN|nr:ABC transporter permease [Actinacidiphila oryziradicis]TKA10520.1 ABC transporter permease [Actinacidiphila oryziradicis]